jgi:hypothetical protein
MSASRWVLPAKVAALAVVSLCAVVLGLFVLLADSGKDSRPDVLLPILLTIPVLALGVRRPAARPAAVAALILATLALAPAPVVLEVLFQPRRSWPLVFAIPWSVGLAAAAGAAALSRSADRPPGGGSTV